MQRQEYQEVMKRKIYSQLLTELSHVVQVRAEGSKAPSPGRVEQTCVYIVNRSAFNRTGCQIYYFRFCCSLIILIVKSANFFIAA